MQEAHTHLLYLGLVLGIVVEDSILLRETVDQGLLKRLQPERGERASVMELTTVVGWSQDGRGG